MSAAAETRSACIRRAPQLRARRIGALAACAATLVAACGDAPADDEEQANGAEREALPYATEVVSFEAGEEGGFGMKDFPDVVLGPPDGKGTGAGSLDVLSLGVGGEIVLGFGERVIVDGDGADLIVFENAFWANGDPDQPFVEPGEVAVSADGDDWRTFDCDPEAAADDSGCAGMHPTLVYDADDMRELDPHDTGGDPFDLAAVQLSEARYVRIRDLTGEGDAAAGTNAGFDLDAVGLVNYRSR